MEDRGATEDPGGTGEDRAGAPDSTSRPSGGGREDNDPGESDESAGAFRSRLFVFLAVSFLWLLASGPVSFEHPLLLVLWPASALLVTWLCDRMGLVSRETIPLELTFRTLGYVPWLGREVVLSSLQVLRCAWWPGARVEPTIRRIESTTRTDVGLVSYANSITLTPGTLTLEADPGFDDQGRRHPTVMVHALVAASLETLRQGEMDARVRHVEEPLLEREEHDLENGA